ncbi:MAG: hypothetical protein GX592_14860 [Clostridiales bacterium]|nr:hypothetical protein [Clostridiales bacterium]
MRYFSGAWKRRRYFEGWYFKQQAEAETVALIPALHVDGQGRASASLQVVAGTFAQSVPFDAKTFSAERNALRIRLGDSVFSDRGCVLNVDAPGCAVRGNLSFGPLTPPNGDIMGPFRFVPGMECRHSVFSLRHRVDGEIAINGRRIAFENASGYIEGDRGASFPRRYLWTQCSWGGNSLMLSVAEIPYLGMRFTGLTGFVFFEGREHRVATYLNAKLPMIADGAAVVRQGPLALSVELLEGGGHELLAPEGGGMTRIIRENICCRARYRCRIGGKPLFEFESDRASFEDDWTMPD